MTTLCTVVREGVAHFSNTTFGLPATTDSMSLTVHLDERIGCSDRHLELPLRDQPDTRFDGFLEFWGLVNHWIVDPQTSNGHIAKDDVDRAEKPGCSVIEEWTTTVLQGDTLPATESAASPPIPSNPNAFRVASSFGHLCRDPCSIQENHITACSDQFINEFLTVHQACGVQSTLF